ncbi:hypothetical protein E0I26_11840 [Flavobacterium rhamnosiphilum]|uniref:Lipoprotein n=1 Tax=Flavobacterium rhamnosiphilum TaxID=2541724 RepID=A0A4V2Z961_9FLAO|nr:hypothetical protein [Flavobacterium rhamnosiphilum]TDE43296.1 hypothetical protein E0I26_11840 [Flavobacterium rhamnosiphilum]
MKKYIYGCLALITMLSCKKSQDDVFYAILDDNFLTLTDTIAYEYHTFFLTPNDTTKPDKNTFDGYKICIDRKFAESKEFRNGVVEVLKTGNYKEYLKLLHEQPNFELKLIDLNRLKQTGKYEIVDFINYKMDRISRTKYVGILKFYKPYINDHHAIIFFLKQSSPKDGVVNAFLFHKVNNKWQLEKKIELMRI